MSDQDPGDGQTVNPERIAEIRDNNARGILSLAAVDDLLRHLAAVEAEKDLATVGWNQSRKDRDALAAELQTLRAAISDEIGKPALHYELLAKAHRQDSETVDAQEPQR